MICSGSRPSRRLCRRASGTSRRFRFPSQIPRTTPISCASAPTFGRPLWSRHTRTVSSPCTSADVSKEIGWFSPDPRGVIPIGGLHVSRSLRKHARRFRCTVDAAFERVMRECGDERRPHGWIDDAFVDAYTEMHRLGRAHSIEVWQGDQLVGGLYGVHIGRLFAGESMFHRVTDASKVALVATMEALTTLDFLVFDVQWTTPHLRSLGAIDLPRSRYLDMIRRAVPAAQARKYGRYPRQTEAMTADSSAPEAPRRDAPWLMRTYSGHSTARASNELYRTNLAKGQTGLSIAFDLPTQTGYDPDSSMAAGEVGKVGVPVAHLGHMRTLLDGIPPGQMNTSMTINATAAWLLALYVANAEEQGVERAQLRGTTQNDIVKEYLSRGTYIFPPVPSRRLIVDMVAWCANNTPKWNPMNVCSYHLQEAGATPVQEIAYSLATAVGVLDAVRDSGQVPAEQLSTGLRIDLVLRERRHPFRRRGVQDARLHRTLGTDRPRTIRRHRRQGPALPLRRPGQFARSHRGPTREQRAAHRARDVGRLPVEAGPCPLDPAPGLERSARSADPMGSAVESADAAGAGLRERPPRVRRHLRRFARDRSTNHRDPRRGVGRVRRGPPTRGRLRSRRPSEGSSREVDGRTHASYRSRRAGRGRRQQLSRDRSVTPRRRRQDREGRSRRRARNDRRRRSLASGP
jgi:leucyl/phenylalanyl-tRNA--protein transferase